MWVNENIFWVLCTIVVSLVSGVWSVLGRHLGTGEMSSGSIYTGCGTYVHLRKLDNAENHENYYVNVTTRHTKHQQHDIKKSCHPFLAYKHPLVLYFALHGGRSTSQYNYWAVHFNHIVNIIVIPPPAVLPRRWIDRRAGAQYLQFIIFKHMFTFTARNT